MSKPAPGPAWALSPEDWGAQKNYDAWKDRWYPKDGIATHHGGNGHYPAAQQPYTVGKEIAQLQNWERYHLSKGWRGLAYNWAVGMTGTVYRVRGWNISGAHLGDIDGDHISNSREIPAVLWITSGTHYEPSDEMIAAFERLRAYMEGQTNPLYLWGHKEIQLASPTSCPGVLNMQYVALNRHSSQLPIPPIEQDDIITSLPTLERMFPEDRLPYQDVRRVQSLLAIEGFIDYGPTNFDDEAKPDGLFGYSTEQAVKEFQTFVGLPATGIVDEDTWAALLGLEDY